MNILEETMSCVVVLMRRSKQDEIYVRRWHNLGGI
jgi:hypothetical protein